MDRELIQSLAKDFESCAIEIDGVECWFARDLQQQNRQGEPKITNEHVKNNAAIRKTLIERGIKPEISLPKRTSKSWRDGLIPKTRSRSSR